MEISKEEITEINKRYGGSPLNLSNLEFELDLAKREKNVYKRSAHLLRGIVGGHPFCDGSKRTATNVVMKELREEGLLCDEERIANGICKIAKSEITNIKKLEGRVRKWCTQK